MYPSTGDSNLGKHRIGSRGQAAKQEHAPHTMNKPTVCTGPWLEDWLVATAQQSCRVAVPPAPSKELGHMYTGIFKAGLTAVPQGLLQQAQSGAETGRTSWPLPLWPPCTRGPDDRPGRSCNSLPPWHWWGEEAPPQRARRMWLREHRLLLLWVGPRSPHLTRMTGSHCSGGPHAGTGEMNAVETCLLAWFPHCTWAQRLRWLSLRGCYGGPHLW